MVNKKEIISELQNRLSSLLEESDAIAKLLRLYGGNDIKLPPSIENTVAIPATSTKNPRVTEKTDRKLKTVINELQRTGDLQSWFTTADLYEALKKSYSKPEKEKVRFPVNMKLTAKSMERDKCYISVIISNHRKYSQNVFIKAIKIYGTNKNQYIYTMDEENFVFNHITQKSEVVLKTLPEKYKSQLSNPAVWIEIK